MLASRSIQQCRGVRLSGNVKPLCRPGLPIRAIPHRPVAARRVQRVSNVRVSAIGNLFGNLLKPLAGGGAKDSPKRRELVEELLEASADPKPDQEIISDIVTELKPFSTKRPVRSTQLFGEYQTIFSTSAGKPKLFLEQPDQARQVSETRSLGFLPATSILFGELNDLDDNTFEIAFNKQETQGGLGGAKKVSSKRRVTIVYLDSDVMVTQQQGEDESGQSVVIYRRTSVEEEAEDARPAGKGTSTTKRSGTGFLGGQKEGTATMAERTVKKREEGTKGTGKAGTTGAKAGGNTAREQLDELAAELKQKQAATKEAAQALKDEERRNATLLRSMTAANAEVAAAAKRVEDAQGKIKDATQGRTQAEQALRSIQAELQAAKAKMK